MSVIVKGMEMPENCSECRLMADYWCYAKTINGQPGPTFMDHRPDWCPLRPMPEKHGRWKIVTGEHHMRWRECSVCGAAHDLMYKWPYCPSCGACMEDGQK